MQVGESRPCLRWGRTRVGARKHAGARSSGEQRATATIKIGIVYSRTGALAAYGAQYVSGLRWGLNYATKGTNKVGNNTIELTLVDDAGDPAKAVFAAKDLIGQGYKILAGSISSGVAVQMAPLAEPEQHPLRLRARPSRRRDGHEQEHLPLGRQTYQDVKAASLVPRLRGGQEGRSSSRRTRSSVKATTSPSRA